MFVFQFTCSLFGMARWSHFFLRSLVSCFLWSHWFVSHQFAVSLTQFFIAFRQLPSAFGNGRNKPFSVVSFADESFPQFPQSPPQMCQQIGPRFLSNFAFFSEVQHPIQIRKFGEGCLIRLHREIFANTRPGQGTSWHAWVDRWRTGCLRHVDRIGPVKSVEWKSG